MTAQLQRIVNLGLAMAALSIAVTACADLGLQGPNSPTPMQKEKQHDIPQMPGSPPFPAGKS